VLDEATDVAHIAFFVSKAIRAYFDFRMRRRAPIRDKPAYMVNTDLLSDAINRIKGLCKSCNCVLSLTRLSKGLHHDV
jgi:hypothetical protein